MKNIVMLVHTEEGFSPPESVYLSDEEYGRGLQCFVAGAVDAVIINRETRTFHLAKRRFKPVPGWWWIGGRRKPGELAEVAIARLFKRETKLDLPPYRFVLVASIDHQLKDRQQEPQELGCHMNAYTFVVELTPEELSSISLDEKEYESGARLTAFTKGDLVRANARQIILDLYDCVFWG